MSSLFVRSLRAAAPRVQSRVAGVAAVPARTMSQMDKKESNMEKDFVAKQEREALARMVAKMQADADPGHKKALTDLEKKLQAAGLSVDDKTKQALLAWKHTAH